MSPKIIRNLADLTVGYEFEFNVHTSLTGDTSKNDNYDVDDNTTNDESSFFINGGGINLNEVDLEKMESKYSKGIYFCGQILDGDGANEGYKFMKDFSTAYIAGKSVADAAATVTGALESSTSLVEEAQ